MDTVQKSTTVDNGVNPPTLNQYIIWKSVPDPGNPAKPTKHPADHHTGDAPVNAQNPAIWTNRETAMRRAHELSAAYGVGFVITKADGYGFIDLDNCLIVDASGKPAWSPLALEILAMFPGAYVEISPSGRGLHIIFSYRGLVPPHGKRLANGLEFYTERRFTTMTGNGAMGNAQIDHTAQMLVFIEKYAKPSTDNGGVDFELTTEPRPEWSGPKDDAPLIVKMLESRSARSIFGGKARFKDLWERNVDKLAKEWPPEKAGSEFNGSSADQAMCNHLAFWTGCHGERMLKLWRESQLNRDKLNREDYTKATIAKACASCTKVYNDHAPDGNAKVQGEDGGMGAGPIDFPPAAREFLRIHFNVNGLMALRYWNGEFYSYQKGVWVPASHDSIKAKVYPFLEAAGYMPKPSDVAGVIDALEAEVWLYEKVKVPSILSAPDRDMSAVIVASNGAFNLDTGERIPLSPDLFALNALPFSYDPNAAEPTEWLKFLNTQWADDPDSITTLQEFAGLLLTPDTHFQKILFLVGPRRSGRGTILRVLRSMIGIDNVVGPTLASLSRQFGLQPLIGKLAAFIGDVRLGAHVDQSVIVERLLSLSGEDALPVERKGIEDYKGKLFVRFIMASNEIPRLADPSGAAASRFVVLVMPHSFLGREDMDLERRLMDELPRILAWAVRGRQRLYERKRFLQPESAREHVKQLEDLGNPLAVFLRERCEVRAGLQVPVDDLYRAWTIWCGSSGIKATGPKEMLGRDLMACQPQIKKRRPKAEGGERYHVYDGIALLPEGLAPPARPAPDSEIDPAKVGFGQAPLPPRVSKTRVRS